MARVLVVGGGPTGSYFAHLLARSAPVLCAATTLWEKSANAGRFASHTPRAPQPPLVSDLGAQYFTASPTCPSTSAALAELRGAGVVGPPLPRGSIVGLRAPHDSGEHFAGGAGGAAGVVRHWLSSAASGGCAVSTSTRLVALDAAPDGGGWVARGEGAGGAPASVTAASAVVLAVPLPQLLQLEGVVASALELSGVAAALSSAAYSSRAVLVLSFAPTGGAREWFSARLPWAARFVGEGDPGCGAVRYVAQSARMRALGGAGGAEGAAPVDFVFHSTVTLGDAAVAAGGIAGGGGGDAAAAWRVSLRTAALAVLEAAAGEAPPFPVAAERFHVWKFSQLTRPPAAVASGTRNGWEVLAAPGGGALLLRAEGGGAPLILAGDGFTESNFSGCVRSAEAALSLLDSALKAK